MPTSAALPPVRPAITRTAHNKRKFWRRLESEVLRRAIYPLIRRREYPGSFAILKEFRKYEFASLAEVEGYQLGRLRSILRCASETVPYYEKLFRSVGFDPGKARLPEEIVQIPILTKSILRHFFQELRARNTDPRLLMPNASGGSTGRPVEFYQDKNYWESSHASRAFFLSWWGVEPGEPMASVWGADRDIPDWSWRQKLYHKLCQIRICNAFALSEERMEQFAREINEWQPRFINGYATALEAFARFLLGRPQFKIRPMAVESSAETLTDAQRKVIEAAFDAPLYNFYGSREVNNLAAECHMHRGLHTNMLSRYIEVVDDAGRPLPEGVPGRILVTDLTNRVMPLIRYENEDIGSWIDAACQCGRPFRMLEKVWGRSSDFITTPAGKLIHGEYFTHLFYHVPEVNTFQVLQKALDEVHISIVLQPGVTNFSLKVLREKISKTLGAGVRCEIQMVETIPRTSSGKHRFTISAVPPSWSGARATNG
jgi:phenylacetate-CoA ligase